MACLDENNADFRRIRHLCFFQLHPGTKSNEKRVFIDRLAIGEWGMVIKPHHMPASAKHHGMARGGIPFHSATKTGVKIGLVSGHKAKLERGAGGGAIGNLIFVRG